MGQRGGSQRTKYSKVARSQKIKFATVCTVPFMHKSLKKVTVSGLFIAFCTVEYR